jgi:hypothetical protein
MVEVGVENVRPSFFEKAPHRSHDSPGGGALDIQTQTYDGVACRGELFGYRAGRTDGGRTDLKPVRV